MVKITYKSSGVNYDLLDNLKRMAQIAGAQTFNNVTDFVLEKSTQGESAFVINPENSDYALAFVQEGLGTKNLVADAMALITGKSYYYSIAQDTVAMIINDLITVGAKPVSISAYWGFGSSYWLENEKNLNALVEGWKDACNLASVAWTNGETPMLSGIINDQTADLAGSAFGIINPKSRLTLGNKLKAGDAIILFESSGIHANGLSLARKLAEQLPDGYKTKLPSKRLYGEALLDPTIIYSKLIQTLFEKKIDIHYMINITGHGWRKLMRHTNKNLQYVINNEMPKVPEVLRFIQEKAQLNDMEAYGNLNMGAGFAVIVPQNQAQKVVDICSEFNIKAYVSGIVKTGNKQVVIEEKNIVFKSESLMVRE